jgi:hypothetical protein
LLYVVEAELAECRSRYVHCRHGRISRDNTRRRRYNEAENFVPKDFPHLQRFQTKSFYSINET